MSQSSFIDSLGRFSEGKGSIEPIHFAIFRTCVALVSIALLLTFGFDLVKQIIDEQFSTRDYTVVEPFDNTTKFGMVGMPSVLVYTNDLSQPSFENVSIPHSYKLSS